MNQLFAFTNGFPATGKSTLCRKLSALLGMKHISTDDARKKLPEDARTLINANPLARHLVYYHTLALAESMLVKGYSVIIDGTFTKKIYRQTAYHVAFKTKTPVYVLQIICNDYKLIQERYARRKKDNPFFKEWAEIKSYNNKYVEYEPLDREVLPDGTPVPLLKFDPMKNLAEVIYSDGSETIQQILEAITSPEKVKA